MDIEKVLKSNGQVERFELINISEFLLSLCHETEREMISQITRLSAEVLSLVEKQNKPIVETGVIKDAVEEVLINNQYRESARNLMLNRLNREKEKEQRFDLMEGVKQILIETNKENANTCNSPSAKLVQIGTAASHTYYLNYVVPEHIADAHKCGLIHIHDLDFYSKAPNCVQLNLDDILVNGYNSTYGRINTPQTIHEAVTLALTVLQNNQNDMYGGQGFPHFDRSMAKFIQDVCPQTSEKEIYDAMKYMIIVLNTVHCHCGVRAPFSSINIGTDTSAEGRLISRSLLKAFDEGMGNGQTPIFPNLVFRVKKGVNYDSGDPNYDLFEQSIRVSSKRMNPTYSFMDSSFNTSYGDEVSYMGCRSRVMANICGEDIAAGRGNLAPITINLPRLAMLSKTPSKEAFFEAFDRVLELCREQLLHRFNLIAQLKVKDFPVLMKQHLYLGSENLKDDDEIRDAIKNGTLVIGFIGLAEALKILTGKHHGESDEAWDLGYEIIEHLSNTCVRYSNEEQLNFVSYATPAEGLSGRFPVLDRKSFGIIDGITDKDYYTNSFHIPVDYNISMFDKIGKEGPFHKITTAGHICYVELSSPPENNPEAMQSIIQTMMESDVGYAGVNFPIDECLTCGTSGIFSGDCPSCESNEIRRIRRITGYLSTVDRFNHGKKAELESRVVHGT